MWLWKVGAEGTGPEHRLPGRTQRGACRLISFSSHSAEPSASLSPLVLGAGKEFALNTTATEGPLGEDIWAPQRREAQSSVGPKEKPRLAVPPKVIHEMTALRVRARDSSYKDQEMKITDSLLCLRVPARHSDRA